MIRKTLLVIGLACAAALSAHAQLGCTYQQLCQRFGEKGRWQADNHSYLFNRGGTYVVTACFGSGPYCDMVMYSHVDGSHFTKNEISGLVHRSWAGEWYAMDPNQAIALWGVNVHWRNGVNVNLYAMLFNNQQFLTDGSGFSRNVQALMIGAQWAFQARGYWKDNSDADVTY